MDGFLRMGMTLGNIPLPEAISSTCSGHVTYSSNVLMHLISSNLHIWRNSPLIILQPSSMHMRQTLWTSLNSLGSHQAGCQQPVHGRLSLKTRSNWAQGPGKMVVKLAEFLLQTIGNSTNYKKIYIYIVVQLGYFGDYWWYNMIMRMWEYHGDISWGYHNKTWHQAVGCVWKWEISPPKFRQFQSENMGKSWWTIEI